MPTFGTFKFPSGTVFASCSKEWGIPHPFLAETSMVIIQNFKFPTVQFSDDGTAAVNGANKKKSETALLDFFEHELLVGLEKVWSI
jgi:hypothetical protein